MTDLLIYLPLGVISGLAAGLFGVGGGIVIVPVLLVAFEVFGKDLEVMTHLAVGTSLACVVLTATSSTMGHHRKGAVMWPWVKRLTPFLIVGGLLGGWTADQLPGEVLTVMLGTFLLVMAFQLFVKKSMAEASAPMRMPSLWILGGSGAFMGWLSAMMGIAGGALAVPFLNAYGAGVRRAVGTSAAIGVPVAASGALSFMIAGLDAPGRPEWSVGFVYLPAFLGIVLTSTLFARVGARLAHAMDQKRLQRLFALFLAVLAVRLIWRTVG